MGTDVLEEPSASISSALKMESACFLETSLPMYQTAWFYTPEDCGLNLCDMVEHWTDYVNIRLSLII
jgi:hypothetical protein